MSVHDDTLPARTMAWERQESRGINPAPDQRCSTVHARVDDGAAGALLVHVQDYVQGDGAQEGVQGGMPSFM